VRDYRINRSKCLSELSTGKYFAKQLERFGGKTGEKVGTFLATGNIISSTGLDLMQVSGYTIVAERLNIYRYMSHFQSVHRGQFFTTMKTTTVRKLLPESWGFLCPVHTPDGSPCGLLNHLARDVVVLSYPTDERLPTTCQGRLREANKTAKWADVSGTGPSSLRVLLASLGLVSAGSGCADGQVILGPSYLPILVDGLVFGGDLLSKSILLLIVGMI
jgi:DNA-directed RNA polymerase I subunit RPA2